MRFINRLAHAVDARAHLLPKGRVRTRLARRAAGRGDAAALRGAPDDPAVLAALGLHDRALAAAASDRAGKVAQIAALAALGEMALAAGRAVEARLDLRERVRVARAGAMHDPAAALALVPDADAVLRAALLLGAGRAAEVARVLADDPGGREVEALRAAAATVLGAWRDARWAIARLYRADGLAVPLREDSDAPIPLTRWLAEQPEVATRAGPAVSVVVAVRDAAASLDMAVGSLVRQGWRSLEIILVDDGSGDASPAMAAAWAARDPRVRVLANDRQPGAAGARNTGLFAATGDWVLFHDADDWAHPEKIARHVATAGAGAGSVSAHFRVDGAGVLRAPRITPFVRLSPICLLVRRAAALAAGPFEAVRHGSDSEYLARLDLLFGRRRIVREPALLTVAGWAPASLSGDPATGLLSRSGQAARLAYRSLWMEAHANGRLPSIRF